MTGADMAAMTELEGEQHGTRWFASFLMMAATHGVIALAFVSLRAPETPLPPPPGAVMIDLAPLPIPDPQSLAAPPVETPPVETPPPPELAPLESPTPEVPPPEEPLLREESPPVVSAPDLPLPDLQPPPKPDAVELAVLRPPKAKPLKVVRAPPKRQPAPVTPQPQATATATPVAAPPTVPSPARSRSWQTDLLAHLERYKRYPRLSRDRREQGVVYVRFAIDRQGRVLYCRLERGSGVSTLDEEAMALVSRASPLPPPPEGDPRSVVELVAPIRYALR